MGEISKPYYAGMHPTLVGQLQEQGRMGRKFKQMTAEGVAGFCKVVRFAKDNLPHGQFGKWVEDELEVSDRTARRFLAFEEYLKPATVAVLGAKQSDKLASPSVPDEAREEIEQRIEAGEDVTPQVVEEVIDNHKDKDSSVPEPSEPSVKDECGREVPSNLIDAFDHRTEYKAIVNAIGALLKRCKTLEESPGGLRLSDAACRKSARQWQNDLKFAMPWAVCPVCDGAGCKGKGTWCLGTGYLVKDQVSNLPSELKAKVK